MKKIIPAKEAVGKAFAEAKSSYGYLATHWADGTVTLWCDNYEQIEEYDPAYQPSDSDLLDLGVIDDDEYKARDAERRRANAESIERHERAALARLKAKYEGT